MYTIQQKSSHARLWIQVYTFLWLLTNGWLKKELTMVIISSPWLCPFFKSWLCVCDRARTQDPPHTHHDNQLPSLTVLSYMFRAGEHTRGTTLLKSSVVSLSWKSKVVQKNNISKETGVVVGCPRSMLQHVGLCWLQSLVKWFPKG